MLKFSQIFEFSKEKFRKILILKGSNGSNGSVPRRSNLSTQVDFVYLPLNFWLRDQDSMRNAKKLSMRGVRLKNKGYGFVHISNAEKEAEFSHMVAESGRRPSAAAS